MFETAAFLVPARDAAAGALFAMCESMKSAPRFLGFAASTLITIACVDGSDLSGGGGSGTDDDGSSSSSTTGSGHAGNTGAGTGGSSSNTMSTSSGPTGCDDPSTPCFDQSCIDSGQPFIDPTLLGAPCGEAVCGPNALGRCLDAGLVPAGQADMLAMCADGTLCVPDRLIASNGNPEPIVCDSIAGAEGRCLSMCIPDVKEQAASAGLPQDVCSLGDVCVPCYSPLDGTSTGACTLGAPGCDAPVDPPTSFASCCDDKGGGKCIPEATLGASAEKLGQDSCAAGSKCVPSVLFEAQMAGLSSYSAPSCTTDGFIGGGEPGACLPTCIPDADSFLLSQGDCNNDYENCAPCETPVIGGSSGACEPIVF